MLLAIDIGNTDIVFALDQDDCWQYVWREKSDADQLSGAYALMLKNYFLENDISIEDVDRSILSSVVPTLIPTIVAMIEMVFDHSPVVTGPSIYSKLAINTMNPTEIGTDLMANAAAAYNVYQDYCLIVDFGTALTFTTIDDGGSIMGVAIAPGIRTAMKSLSWNTAQLPEIELELPSSVLGKHTTHAMQAGILFGYIGLVEKMIDTIHEEIGRKCQVIATGGLSHVLTPLHTKFDKINRNLTLDGLKVMANELGK